MFRMGRRIGEVLSQEFEQNEITNGAKRTLEAIRKYRRPPIESFRWSEAVYMAGRA